jgi:hypothetical protein
MAEHVRFDISVKITIFWDVTPTSCVHPYGRIDGIEGAIIFVLLLMSNTLCSTTYKLCTENFKRTEVKRDDFFFLSRTLKFR